MGSCVSRRGDSPGATAEFYPDKVVKYAVIPPILLLALIAVIVLYGVDKVKCSSRNGINYGYTLTEVNDYCWNNPRPAFQINRINYTIWNHTLFSTPPPNATVVTYKVWVENPPLLRHKLFPILLLCECACLTIPLLIWHWCIAQEIRSHTKAILNHSNSLTAAYQKFDHSQLRSDEAAINRLLDNYLEYLSYLLSCKARRLYILHLIKWIVMLVITVAWFGGNLGLFSPDFEIFRDRFTCLFNGALQIAYDCYFPTAVFLRVIWYVNIVILGILVILILIHILVDMCLPRKYQDTYLHRGVPGAMDYRLADCIQKNHNPRYYWLLSKLCDENEHLCTDPGLSRSLARKYGSHLGGRGGYGDKSASSGEEKGTGVKQDQIDRFVKVTDNPDKSSPLCGGCFGSCCAGRGTGDDEGLASSPGGKQYKNGPANGNSRKGLPEQGTDGDVNDPYMRQKQGLASDFTPEHLYLRELIRYKYPDGLNPKFPVDHPNSVKPNNREIAPYRSAALKSSPRRVVFRSPKRLKHNTRKKRRRQSISSPRQPDVIILEDLDDYPPAAATEPDNKLYGGDHGQYYHNPYGGALSSRVIKPYYDIESGEYKDFNPLAYKLRQKVRKTMSRNVKVWRP